MRGDDHTAAHTLRPHRDLEAVVEAAHHLAFRTLLELIGGKVQPRLNQRMIEQVIVFPARHKRERGHIGEHRPVAILPIQTREPRDLVDAGRPPDTDQWLKGPCAVPPGIDHSRGCRNCRADFQLCA
jgi:hypothetical protein